MRSGDDCIIYIDVLMTNFSVLYSISLFLLPILYVQQCSQLTGAAQCDVYKCNVKSNVCLITN